MGGWGIQEEGSSYYWAWLISSPSHVSLPRVLAMLTWLYYVAWRAGMGDFVSGLLWSTIVLKMVGVAVRKWRGVGEGVYLVEHSAYRAPGIFRISYAGFQEHARMMISDVPGEIPAGSLAGNPGRDPVGFQRAILERSGLGDETCLPEGFRYIPMRATLKYALAESRQVVFGALDGLFRRTHLPPCRVGILVVNCSLFSPIPSLSALIVHRYRMHAEVRVFNLSGMGCSAGLIAVALAASLLCARRDAGYAVIVSTENMTQNSYRGRRRDMLLPNCLFRMGASAVLLATSGPTKSKYKLTHVVRTHRGADDVAFACVRQENDEDGHVGVALAKELPRIAGKALVANMSSLGPLVLPAAEMLKFAMDIILRKLGQGQRKPYSPDFKRAFQHFCIHAGGRAVIDELQKSMQLRPLDVEASRMTLYRFGNTSSSSVWYELAYIEAKGRVKKDDKVWQIAFGSGFKCNSIVWKALINIEDCAHNDANPWSGIINEFPVAVEEVRKIN